MAISILLSIFTQCLIEMLPDGASGYQAFTDWWQSVDQVDVRGFRVVEIQENLAVIDVDLTYQQGKKITPETLRVNLVWNEGSKQWQINTTNRQ